MCKAELDCSMTVKVLFTWQKIKFIIPKPKILRWGLQDHELGGILSNIVREDSYLRQCSWYVHKDSHYRQVQTLLGLDQCLEMLRRHGTHPTWMIRSSPVFTFIGYICQSGDYCIWLIYNSKWTDAGVEWSEVTISVPLREP